MGPFIWTAAALASISAVLTLAETAVFRVGPSRVRTLQGEGFPKAHALASLRSAPPTFRLGIRLFCGGLDLLAVGLLVTAVVPPALASGTGSAVLRVAGTAMLVLFVSDALPRLVVSRHPVRLALWAAPLLLHTARWFSLIGAPLTFMEEALVPEGEGQKPPHEREYAEISKLGREEGMVGEDENLLVERAFRLDETTAWDVMTPRVDVFALPDTRTLEEVVGELSTLPYSRVPVYGETVDDITGVLYVRDAYEAVVGGRGGEPISRIAREAFFVPGSLSLSRLLQDFQAQRVHLGIVADEFGGTDGLVTLEDVLEELVGEIVDERDLEEEEELVVISSTEVEADAGVDVREVNDLLGVSLPDDEHRSLNGFILEELGYVPAVGEILDRSGMRIEVTEATETQVIRARITLIPQGESTESSNA
ncbi:MAG: hemolysin family protein [Gemmatimonadota bacterium]|nr:hemolysin family protein [Gemmatimonadota bacterium]